MHERKKVAREGNFAAALVLLGLAVALFVLFYQSATKHGLTGQTASEQQHAFLERSRGLDDRTKEDLKKFFAGFWELSDSPSDANPLGIKDRLELKDNGIIWQVRHYRLRLPSDSVVQCYHVMQSYIEPFSRQAKDTGAVVCEARIIRQVYVLPGDTCYGPSSVDLVWRAEKKGNRLVFDGFTYTPYPTTVLDTFFPPGMIKLVDDVKVRQCGRTMSVGSWTKEMISRGAGAMPGATGADGAAGLVAKYYDPVCIGDAGRRLREAGIETVDSLHAALRISWDGSVENVSLSGTGRALKDSLAAEAKTWRFAARQSGSPPLEVIAVLHPERRP